MCPPYELLVRQRRRSRSSEPIGHSMESGSGVGRGSVDKARRSRCRYLLPSISKILPVAALGPDGGTPQSKHRQVGTIQKNPPRACRRGMRKATWQTYPQRTPQRVNTTVLPNGVRMTERWTHERANHGMYYSWRHWRSPWTQIDAACCCASLFAAWESQPAVPRARPLQRSPVGASIKMNPSGGRRPAVDPRVSPLDGRPSSRRCP